jgi:hypothetical protein
LNRPGPFRYDLRPVLQATLGAFAGFTGGWILAAMLSGDELRVSDPFRLLGLAVPTTAGALFASRVQRWPWRALLGIAAIAALVFWIAVPDGWWALPPPR